MLVRSKWPFDEAFSKAERGFKQEVLEGQLEPERAEAL